MLRLLQFKMLSVRLRSDVNTFEYIVLITRNSIFGTLLNKIAHSHLVRSVLLNFKHVVVLRAETHNIYIMNTLLSLPSICL